ncbi:MAG: hypothetical protein RM049_11000 [Nostoc sp. DedQUE04]|uniref:hypothetical protein n=1 Tax=Nostoc sp. DedQUE04 TaxID=3075390 RepID=UPI002AD355EE|nr:hypothetical protein [Nostoc sp. DedQUE04]MDZ8135814.1 hypothetical protein [Nostoc sp. DedQUE04]
MEPNLVTDPKILNVLNELRQREPIFHRPELGTTRADFPFSDRFLCPTRSRHPLSLMRRICHQLEQICQVLRLQIPASLRNAHQSLGY